MARPRALDDKQIAQLRKHWRRAPDLAALVAYAKQQGWTVGKSALDNYRREIWPDSEDAGQRVRRQVQQQAKERVRAGAAGVGAEEGQAPGVDEEELDHRAILREQLKIARRMAQEEADPKVMAPLGKLIRDLLADLRDLDKAAATDSGPRVVFYFPEVTHLEMLEANE